MASVVDLCNLALSHLGDAATVASIDPPDGSAQADHCARFYPVARDATLELHAWGFATVRAPLALLASNPSTTWKYAYGVPPDVINYLAVLQPDAPDDYSAGVQIYGGGPYSAPVVGMGQYTPQAYEIESNGNVDILLCNVESAVLRYTQQVTDTTRYTPLFRLALSHRLASMLAGPVLKGEVGRSEAAAQLKLAAMYQAQAEASDANQRNVKPAAGASWMVLRG